MSLFKVCNWWTVQAGDSGPNYDSFSLLCCRLGPLEETEKDCVIVGSHAGFLTIYRPAFSQHEDDEYSSFSPSDVVLETRFEDPVIGMVSGKFSSASEVNLLAVLHPQKLAVYALVTKAGLAEHGDQSHLQLVHSHVLKSPAFCVCKGHFGGVKGREFMCVCHLDGRLKFFEQDGISFECQLPDERTIPGPFLYVSRVDCFVTVSPSWELECFRYQDLIDSEQIKKKIVPIWSLCIGEGINDINVHQITNSESIIVLLGDHNLIAVSDTGKVKFIKRLDFTALCMTSFVVGWYFEQDARLMIAVASDNGSVLLFDTRNLVWAAQLPEVPVSIGRANLSGLSGAIVSLSASGTVGVGYLGSDPHVFKAPPLDLKQLDFQKAHAELHELEREIQRGVDFSDVTMINAATERDFRVQVSLGEPEKCTFPTKLGPEEDPKMVRISVGMRTQVLLEGLQVSVFAPPPFKASVERFMFTDVLLDQTERLDTFVFLERAADVPNLEVLILISIVDKQTLVRVVEKRVSLPPELVFKLAPAQREAKFKVTLASEEQVRSLNKLHPGVQDDNATAVALRSVSGSVVTVAISKSSNRIRIQSDHVEAIPAVLYLALSKLCLGSSFAITPPNLPIDPLLDCLKESQQLRDNFNVLLLEIDRRYAELRLFEIRLTLKSQEANAKVSGIQYLINLTNSKIEVLERRIKSLQDEIGSHQIRLSCLVFLIKTMLQYTELPKKVSETLTGLMSHSINNFLEQSWEEATFPAFDMMEHVGPLRSDRSGSGDDYFSSEVFEEYSMGRFLKSVGNVLSAAMKMAIKSGAARTDEDEEFRVAGEDQKESEWVNEVPQGPAALLGQKTVSEDEGADFVDTIKEESEEEE